MRCKAFILKKKKKKRRTLFTMLIAGRWDVVALQETHHVSDAEGERWAVAGSGPLHPWPGVSFWSQLGYLECRRQVTSLVWTSIQTPG